MTLVYWWCVGLLLLYLRRTHSQDYSDTEFCKFLEGSSGAIKCPHHKNNLTWEFQRCQRSYTGVQCNKNTTWIQIRGHKKLEIQNARAINVGNYRCLHEKMVVKKFLVDVVDMRASPEVISVVPSANGTIPLNAPLVIQCKTTSVIPPAIRWLKNCAANYNCEIRDDDVCYCPVPSANESILYGEHVYLSKLTIPRSRSLDSGTYVCLVLSVNGKDQQNITIEVEETLEVERANESFLLSLLFVIPLGFLLVPVTVWLCYYKRKKRVYFNEQQRELIKPVTVQVRI